MKSLLMKGAPEESVSVLVAIPRPQRNYLSAISHAGRCHHRQSSGAQNGNTIAFTKPCVASHPIRAEGANA
jgi:hypothetical protein